MLLEDLPHRALELGVGVQRQCRDIGRWRRKLLVEQVFQDELAADHRRGAKAFTQRLRRQRQDRGMGHDAAALRQIDRHLAEFVASDAADAIELGQARIDEGVVGIEQVGDGAVVGDDVVEELLGLALHRGEQRLVHVGRVVEAANLEPLAQEILGQRDALGAFQHARHLGFQVLLQRARLGFRIQRVVRHRTPEEIGKAAGELVIVEREDRALAIGLGVALHAEEEFRRHQRGANRQRHGAVDGFVRQTFLGEGHVDELHQAGDLGIADGTAEGARRKGEKVDAHLLHRVGVVGLEILAGIVEPRSATSKAGLGRLFARHIRARLHRLDTGLLGGFEIALYQQRRQGQRIGVVVEAFSALVGGEIGRSVPGRGQIEQVAQRIGVFAVVQAAHDERARIGLDAGQHAAVDEIH